MNILDIIFIIIVGFFFLRGFFRGFIIETMAILGLVAGFFLANKYHGMLAPHLVEYIPHPGWAGSVAYFLIFIASIILLTLSASILDKFFKPFAPLINTTLGGCIGLLKGTLICLVALFVLSNYTPQAPFYQNSTLAPELESITTHLRQLFPEAFTKIEKIQKKIETPVKKYVPKPDTTAPASS